MAATVIYKNVTLTTIKDATKKLLTSGKYLEDDVTITDITNTGLPVGIAKYNFPVADLGFTWICTAEENI